MYSLYNDIIMRTTIAIDDELIDDLMKLESGVSRSEAIRRAVQDYLKRKQFEEFLSLAGSKLVDLDWRQTEQEELRKVKQHGRKRQSIG
jgi:metal-responsive CopG/Arc/MetJ family transcriptional regulator